MNRSGVRFPQAAPVTSENAPEATLISRYPQSIIEITGYSTAAVYGS